MCCLLLGANLSKQMKTSRNLIFTTYEEEQRERKEYLTAYLIDRDSIRNCPRIAVLVGRCLVIWKTIDAKYEEKDSKKTND